MSGLEEQIFAVLQSVYDRFSWGGVVAMMLLENATGLTPSEVILGLAGWMLIDAHGLPISFSFLGGLLAALGSVAGASIMYWVARLGGRPAIDRMARWVGIRPAHIQKAEDQFHRWGYGLVFFGRMIPGIRTIINIPAGLARMPFWKFFAATFAGAYLWCTLLLAAGAFLGHEWPLIRDFLGQYGIWIAVTLAAAFGLILGLRWIFQKNRLSIENE